MLIEGLYRPLIYLSIASVLVPLLAGLARLKTLSVPLRVLFAYVVICAITELVSHWGSKHHEASVHVVQNVFTLAECLIFLFLFFSAIRVKLVRVLITVAGAGYLILFIVAMSGSNWLKPNIVTTTAEALLMILFSIVFFFHASGENQVLTWTSDPMFWVSLAVFLYFATAFSLFLFGPQLANPEFPESFMIFHSLQRVVNIAYNLMLATALWRSNRQ